jgi:hypothetical protein
VISCSLTFRNAVRCAAVLVLPFLFVAVPPASAARVTLTFDTPGAHTWTVPTGVEQATFELFGAAGGSTGGQGEKGRE